MINFRKRFALVASLAAVLTLSACFEKKVTYGYLMLHPEYLQRVYNQCVQEIADPALSCELIMHAQADMTTLITERERDPERFGARILQEQENARYLKTKADAAWQAYQIIGSKKAPLEELKTMRQEVEKAQAEYKSSADQVSVLLTVIRVTSVV